jgi:hypothetical protein
MSFEKGLEATFEWYRNQQRLDVRVQKTDN